MTGGFDTLAGGTDEDEQPPACPVCGTVEAYTVVVRAARGTQFPDDPDHSPDGERPREMHCCSGCGTVYDPALAARD